MAELSWAPCLRPGCRSPQGHPNCRCYSDVSTSSLEQAGYKRPGSTLGLKKRTNPDTGESWYAGPGNGVSWSGSQTPNEAQSTGRRLAGKFIQAAKWGASTLGKIGSTFFADGGDVHPRDLVGPHHLPGCHHYRDGGEVDAYNEMLGNPDLALDYAIVHHGMVHALSKTGHSKSEDLSRVMEDHLESSRRGKKEIKRHAEHLFETGKDHRIESDKDRVKALHDHMEEYRLNPAKMLELGGTLADTLPGHAAALGAKAATASNYLNSIRPKPQQLNPMDPLVEPNQAEEAKYRRQLAVMENPSLVYQGVKDSRISPEDLQTLQAVYPKLFEKMKYAATEKLIDMKTKGETPSFKHRHALGSLMGQPLDYSQSPEAAMAIMKANAGAQGQPEPASMPKRGRSGATAVSMKQINMVDQLTQTPIEASQIAMKKP